jgi:drug/metabolite transporter (DMT)-like permease
LALNIILLFTSVFTVSTAVIMIKVSTLHPALLAALRLFVATLVLTPLFVREVRRHRATYTWTHVRASLLPGLILAAHFISWNTGARMAPTANASFIIGLAPLAMPFFLTALLREQLTRNEIAATAIALGALVVLTSADLNLSAAHFWGDVICFTSMLFYAGYMALGRKNRHFPSVWLYLVPLYAVAGVVCFALALFLVDPFQAYSSAEIWLVLGLGIIPTVIGHSLLNRALRYFRGQRVSIINMGQFVFAGILAYFFFGEIPHGPFFIASGLLMVSVFVAMRNFERR